MKEGKWGVARGVEEEEEAKVEEGDGGAGDKEGDGVGKEMAGEKGAESKT